MKFKLLLAALVCFSCAFSQANIVAISGSTREASFNKKLLKQAVQIARKKGASVTYIDLKNYKIPLYDGDLEATSGMPRPAKEIRDKMIASDGIMISTPEYNGSISAVLKNAIDWISRGEKGGSSYEPFKGKAFALMSASPGKGGGKKALEHLTFIIKRLGGNVVATQVSIHSAFQAFDKDGKLKDPSQVKELEKEVEELLKAVK